MASIEQEIVVKIGEGEVVFREPGMNFWALFQEKKEGDVDGTKQLDILLTSYLKDVRGLAYADGAVVTVEDLKAKKDLPYRVGVLLVKGYFDELRKMTNPILGAEEKNG